MTLPRKNLEFEESVARAAEHYAAGRFAEAAVAYRAALNILPDHAGVLHNLGVVAASQGNHRSAIECFDAALAVESRYASAHYNRAVALNALGQRTAAIDAFARALALEPENYAGHRAIGFSLLAERQRGRALDHFARTYELRRGDDRRGIAAKSLCCSNRSKLLHDAEQFRYLARVRRDSRRFEAMARNYEAIAEDFPIEVTELSDADIGIVGENYNTAISITEAPEIPEGVLGPRQDRDRLVQDFRRGQSGVVYFDNFLTPRALASLRRYLLESTIWHDFSHIRGFVASYFEDGLACPLLLQIVDELRCLFPELLGNQPLSQAWAFKALGSKAAIDVHADDGAISVNFWVTPTEANFSYGRGGLGVCRVPPPADWAVKNYDDDRERAVKFLEQHYGTTLIVPYEENRSVLFESRLLHYSDSPEFAENYENHRINITLLFGSSRTSESR